MSLARESVALLKVRLGACVRGLENKMAGSRTTGFVGPQESSRWLRQRHLVAGV